MTLTIDITESIAVDDGSASALGIPTFKDSPWGWMPVRPPIPRRGERGSRVTRGP